MASRAAPITTPSPSTGSRRGHRIDLIRIDDPRRRAQGAANDGVLSDGADAARDKPTFLSLMGERAAADYAQALCERAVQALAPFGERAQPLADIARFIVARDR